MLTLTYLLGSCATGIVKILLTVITFKDKDWGKNFGIVFFLKFYVHIFSTCKYIILIFQKKVKQELSELLGLWDVSERVCCCFACFFYLFSCTISQLWHVGSSSLTRAGTLAPALGAWSVSHWMTREVPASSFIYTFPY